MYVFRKWESKLLHILLLLAIISVWGSVFDISDFAGDLYMIGKFLEPGASILIKALRPIQIKVENKCKAIP